MVVLNKIYTRTGDDGTSALGTGERRPKSDLRFAAIGTVDETNAHVGLARLQVSGRARRHADAHPERPLRSRRRPRHAGQGRERASGCGSSAAQVARLEGEIDDMNAGLQPLTSFVLPGGSAGAAALHLCRTVARRAERLMVELDARETAQSRGAPLHQPAVRLLLRRRARRQRSRRRRRPLGAGREPLSRAMAFIPLYDSNPLRYIR